MKEMPEGNKKIIFYVERNDEEKIIYVCFDTLETSNSNKMMNIAFII